jgi:hypothetical protein
LQLAECWVFTNNGYALDEFFSAWHDKLEFG